MSVMPNDRTLPLLTASSGRCQEATCLMGRLGSRTPTRLRAELFHTAGCLFDEGGNGTGIGDVDCVTGRHVMADRQGGELRTVYLP